jgi:TetR/AcrR family transcriptional regulator, regulator of biofilm formation and stress response
VGRPAELSGRQGPPPRGAARREALIDAALKIIAEAGADALTHRRVAAVADLPLASTTYWFESKDDLLLATLELACERDIARLRACVEAEGVETAPLELAVNAILGPSEEIAGTSRSSLLAVYALLLEAARRPALQLVARRWTDVYRETLGSLLARAGSQQPGEDAELLLAAADGLLLDQLASGDAHDVAPGLRRLALALLAAA